MMTRRNRRLSVNCWASNKPENIYIFTIRICCAGLLSLDFFICGHFFSLPCELSSFLVILFGQGGTRTFPTVEEETKAAQVKRARLRTWDLCGEKCAMIKKPLNHMHAEPWGRQILCASTTNSVGISVSIETKWKPQRHRPHRNENVITSSSLHVLPRISRTKRKIENDKMCTHASGAHMRIAEKPVRKMCTNNSCEKSKWEKNSHAHGGEW